MEFGSPYRGRGGERGDCTTRCLYIERRLKQMFVRSTLLLRLSEKESEAMVCEISFIFHNVKEYVWARHAA